MVTHRTASWLNPIFAVFAPLSRTNVAIGVGAETEVNKRESSKNLTKRFCSLRHWRRFTPPANRLLPLVWCRHSQSDVSIWVRLGKCSCGNRVRVQFRFYVAWNKCNKMLDFNAETLQLLERDLGFEVISLFSQWNLYWDSRKPLNINFPFLFW